MIETYMSNKDVMFKYALGKSVAEGMEIHPYHEILLFVGKSATFITEHMQMVIHPNTMILIPKGQYHGFNIEDQDSYERYVLNFFDRAEIQDLTDQVLPDMGIIVHPSRQMAELFYRLKESNQLLLSDRERELMLNATVTLLLLELKLTNTKQSVQVSQLQKTLVSKAIEYIGTNYTKQIKIDDIANALQISSTKLAKQFKDEMGISIHKYIVEKRLVYAYDKIAKGESPTDVCFLCGYSDYSSFYRAYKKMFEKSPSDL